MTDATTYLDPDTLARMQALELSARQIVAGYLSGLHRSAQHGFSVEFAQHREYVPGDDFKHIDWKVFARNDRFYLKQYELETNLIAWCIIDASESMRYGSGERSKYDVACQAAMALAYLLVNQGDSAGLVTFDHQVRTMLRPSSNPTQLQEMLRILCTGPAPAKTNVGEVFHHLAERISRRCVLLLFSDLFDEPEPLLEGLRHLRYAQHEVIVFHVLDPAERDFPFQQTTLFRGLEEWPQLLTDPRGVRQAYLAELEAFLTQIQQGCKDHRVDYVPLSAADALGLRLASYLSERGRG